MGSDKAYGQEGEKKMGFGSGLMELMLTLPGLLENRTIADPVYSSTDQTACLMIQIAANINNMSVKKSPRIRNEDSKMRKNNENIEFKALELYSRINTENNRYSEGNVFSMLVLQS